jgi:hypothetical protein
MLSAGCVFVAYYGLAVVKFGSIETLTDSSPMMSRLTPTHRPQRSLRKRRQIKGPRNVPRALVGCAVEALDGAK